MPKRKAEKNGEAEPASKKGKGGSKVKQSPTPAKKTATAQKQVAKKTPPQKKGKATAATKKGDAGNKMASKKGSATPKKAKAVEPGPKKTAAKKTPSIQQKVKASGQPPSSKSISGPLNLRDLLKEPKWKAALLLEFDQDYFKGIETNLAAEYGAGKQVFPPQDLIFNAFNLTPMDKVKVVILGQDPYHDDGQAMGLSFSVPPGIAVPGSLKNIYNELERDPKIPGFTKPDHGCLQKWATEGILMINATLTVEAHKPNSHAKFGWQKFTDNVIKIISEKCSNIAFILWGGFAHKKAALIDGKKHAVIKTAHPSPLSIKHFKECNCFSDCNEALKKFGQKPVTWLL